MLSPLLAAYVLFVFDNVLRETVRLLKRTDRTSNAQTDRRSSLGLVFYLASTLLLPLVNIASGDIDSLPVQWLGILIMMAGIGVHVWAMHELGQFYTGKLQITKRHVLVKTGLYAIVRHPGYLGVAVLSFGFGLAVGNWVDLLVIMSIFALTHLYRMRIEEEMLIERFGDDYRGYMRCTKRLIPFIY